MSAAREVAARLALLRVQHRSLLQLAAARHGGGTNMATASIAPSSSAPPTTTAAAAADAAAGTRSLSFLSSSSSSSGSSGAQAAAAALRHQQRPQSTSAAAPDASPRRAYASAPSWSTALRPHATAPRPLPRVRRLREGFTWRRMVVRVPPEVSVELVEDGRGGGEGGKPSAAAAAAAAGGVDGARRRRLVLSGRAGRLELNLAHLDPTGLVAMQLWKRPSGGGGSESAAEGGDGATAAAGLSAAAEAALSNGGGALLLCASPDRRCFRGIATHVDNAVRGVTQGYLQGVAVKGVGYRLEPYFEEGRGGAAAAVGKDGKPAAAAAAAAPAPAAASKRRLFWEPPPVLEGAGPGGGGGGGGKNARSVGAAVGPAVTYPVTRPASAVRMKVGFKAAAVVRLPAGVRAFFVRPTLAYLYGADRAAVGNAAASLRAVRPPNAYTGNGVQLVGEEIKLRQRAGAK